MSGVLVVAEHLQGRLRDVTRELVTAAVELGGPVTVAVIARDPGPLAEAANLAGVDEIVTVRVDSDEFEADSSQSALEALVAERRPDVTLLGFTVNSMGFGPAVAAKLGTGFASDVFGFTRDGDAIVATRSFYGSKVQAELEFPSGSTLILLLRPTVWQPAEGPGQATVTELAVPSRPSRARHLEFVEAPASDVDITDVGLPALDRPRHRRTREHRAVRRACGEDGCDAVGVATDRRRRLDAQRSPGRSVGQDRQAEGVPRVRHLGCGAAPGRDEDERARSSPSTATPRPPSSTSPTTGQCSTCSRSLTSSTSSSDPPCQRRARSSSA